METADVVVIGAGVIGLSVARELAGTGLKVVSLTRDEPGSGASSASAGMLEVHFPAPIPPPLAILCNASRPLYDELSRELESETGLSIGLDLSGTVCLAATAEQMKELEVQCSSIPGSRMLRKPDEWTSLDGGIKADLAGGLLLPDDHHVDPRSLCKALLLSCEKRGVRFRRGVTVKKLKTSQGKIESVETDTGAISAGWAINAAGAWAGTMEGLGVPVPVRPVKGQLLAMELPPSPSRVLHGTSVYMVPQKRSRSLLVGATVEEAGWDALPRAHAVLGLLSEGMRLLEPLRDAPFREVRVGFRPGTPDALPILGPSGHKGLLLAAGHFRKGILLAPITAKIISALVGGTPPPVPVEPYSAARFER